VLVHGAYSFRDDLAQSLPEGYDIDPCRVQAKGRIRDQARPEAALCRESFSSQRFFDAWYNHCVMAFDNIRKLLSFLRKINFSTV